MRKNLLMAALAAALIAPGIGAEERQPDKPSGKQLKVGHAVGQRVPQFTADVLTIDGDKETKGAFDSHKLKRPTAFVFVSRTCPYVRAYQDRLAELSRTFEEKGIDFVIVYPTRATKEDQKKAFHKSAGFEGQFLNDQDAGIAKKLNILKTPEVVLTRKTGEIAFRGGIDDNWKDGASAKNHYFRDACKSVAAGGEVAITTAPTFG